MTASEHHPSKRRGRRRHPLLEWYEKTTGTLIDRMCCCSYSEGQIYNEAEPADYDSFEADLTHMVPAPAWAAMDDTYVDALDPDVDRSAKAPRKSNNADATHSLGHLTLCGGDPWKAHLCLHHSPDSNRSVSTATTVSTSTIRTVQANEGYLYRRAEHRSERSARPEGHASGARYPRVETGPTQHHSYSDSHLAMSAPRRPVNSSSLPDLPYFTLTEGYEV